MECGTKNIFVFNQCQWEPLPLRVPQQHPPSQQRHLKDTDPHISRSLLQVFISLFHRYVSPRNAHSSSLNAFRWPRLSKSTLPPPLVSLSLSIFHAFKLVTVLRVFFFFFSFLVTKQRVRAKFRCWYFCGCVAEGAANEEMKAGSSGLVGENDLLIVGPGVLGRIVAEKWREVVY